MPSFEKSSIQEQTSQRAGGGSYDKILAIFNNSQDRKTTALERSKRVNISLKTAENFESTLMQCPSGDYRNVAGSDISAIFMPYQTMLGSGSHTMPAFASGIQILVPTFQSGSGINTFDILPFQWDFKLPNVSGLVYDRTINPSGDGFKNLVSGNQYYGDSDRYRNISEERGIGLRLPAMGVGWGFTTKKKPWPAGSGTLFKGDVAEGYRVDPKDYIAAPIDLRYDTKRNVWSATGGADGIWAKILNAGLLGENGNLYNIYSWIEMTTDASGIITSIPISSNPSSGTLDKNWSYEVNNTPNLPSGLIVWLIPDENSDNYSFFYPGPATGEFQYQEYVVVAQHRSGWTFDRSCPLILNA